MAVVSESISHAAHSVPFAFEHAALVHGATRINRHAAAVNMLDDAMPVYNECRAVCKPVFGIENPIIFADLALEIAQQGKREAVLLGKNSVGG